MSLEDLTSAERQELKNYNQFMSKVVHSPMQPGTPFLINTFIAFIFKKETRAYNLLRVGVLAEQPQEVAEGFLFPLIGGVHAYCYTKGSSVHERQWRLTRKGLVVPYTEARTARMASIENIIPEYVTMEPRCSVINVVPSKEIGKYLRENCLHQRAADHGFNMITAHINKSKELPGTDGDKNPKRYSPNGLAFGRGL
jgi:hypothetical protein